MIRLIGTAALYSLAVLGADRVLAWACEQGVRWYRWHVIKRDMARTCERIQKQHTS